MQAQSNVYLFLHLSRLDKTFFGAMVILYVVVIGPRRGGHRCLSLRGAYADAEDCLAAMAPRYLYLVDLKQLAATSRSFASVGLHRDFLYAHGAPLHHGGIQREACLRPNGFLPGRVMPNFCHSCGPATGNPGANLLSCCSRVAVCDYCVLDVKFHPSVAESQSRRQTTPHYFSNATPSQTQFCPVCARRQHRSVRDSPHVQAASELLRVYWLHGLKRE